MRIAFCLPDSDWLRYIKNNDHIDAAYIQQQYIVDGLKAHQNELTLFAPYQLDQVVYLSDQKNLITATQSWSKSLWFRFASKVTWRLQKVLRIPYLNFFSNYARLDGLLHTLSGHDLAYERNGLYNVSVAMACKQLRIPYIIFFDADQILEQDYIGKPITGLLRWRAEGILKYNLRTAHAIICVSQPAKDHLVREWNVAEEKIAVFPNGVDTKKFHPNDEFRREVRLSLGIGENPLIIFVGNFYQWHDVATLLDSFAGVLSSHPDARLILLGDGDKKEAMVKQAENLGVQHAVNFTGLVSHTDVPRFLAASDIAVVPVPKLDRELWLSPMKLFEYMASGNAIVATNTGQISMVVHHEQNGLLIPPGDTTTMVEAINKLIENPDFRRTIGRNARKDAIENYSWEQYILRLETLFQEVHKGNSINSI